jgi:hypothetical protein
MNNTIWIVLGLVALFIGSTLGSRYKYIRSIQQVLKIFSGKNAFEPQNAVKAEEIGMFQRSLFFRFGMRDYKLLAFQGLVQANVIETVETEEGNKYYLPKEKYDKYIKKK